MADTGRKSSWSMLRRLALGLALSVGGVLTVLFLALDYWIDIEIYRRLDASLLERTRAVARVLDSRDLAQLEQLMPEYDPDGHTEFFTVYDNANRALLHSSSTGGVDLDLGPSGRGAPRYYDLTLPDGHAGRALATRLSGDQVGSPPRLLVVASEREGWDRTERRIHFTLLGAIACALVLTMGLGLLVVGRIFAVLRRSSRQVAALDVDVPQPAIGNDFPSELQPFAAAFNRGIRRLYDAIDRERRFSRDVAHELRTPLAEIRASAESALASGEPEEAATSLRAAVDASARMQRSVDTLLALSRLESGLEQPAIDPMDLAQVVHELVIALRSSADAHGVTVRCGTLPAAAWVRSDRGIVERIVSNLLRNAIEYSPERSSIDCRLHHDESGWWLQIDNPAPELTNDDLKHFGHRFWRKQPEGGTTHHAGLGLSLSLALARFLSLPLHFSLREGWLCARLGPWPPL